MRLRYAAFETFIEKFAPNVTRGGLFLASRTPRPIGEVFQFEVQLAGGEVALSGDGKVTYLNFSGNVHMDGVIYEIPPGKSLAPRHNFYEQNVIGLVGRGYTVFGCGPNANKVEWGEGSLFTVPLNVFHRHYNFDPANPPGSFRLRPFR